MTKKRRHICLLLIGAVLFLYGCADGTDETGKVLPSYAVEASLQGEPQNSGDLEEPEDTHQVESHTQEGIDMDVLNKAVNRILEVGSREFLGSYPIDESFLFWFRSTYGKEALEQIADEATAGRDANIWYEVSGSSIHVLWLDYCEKFDAHREYFARLTRKEALSQEQIV